MQKRLIERRLQVVEGTRRRSWRRNELFDWEFTTLWPNRCMVNGLPSVVRMQSLLVYVWGFWILSRDAMMYNVTSESGYHINMASNVTWLTKCAGIWLLPFCPNGESLGSSMSRLKSSDVETDIAQSVLSSCRFDTGFQTCPSVIDYHWILE